MLLYLPVHRCILGRIIRSRKLYITPNAIVYKVSTPLLFPCFGVLEKEKHVLLASVADVVIEQGYLQSRYGVYSIRIQSVVGVTRPPSDDVQIEGITNPQAFRKMSNVGELAILQKLEEVGNSLKRVQSLIEERQHKTH